MYLDQVRSWIRAHSVKFFMRRALLQLLNSWNSSMVDIEVAVAEVVWFDSTGGDQSHKMIVDAIPDTAACGFNARRVAVSHGAQVDTAYDQCKEVSTSARAPPRQSEVVLQFKSTLSNRLMLQLMGMLCCSRLQNSKELHVHSLTGLCCNYPGPQKQFTKPKIPQHPIIPFPFPIKNTIKSSNELQCNTPHQVKSTGMEHVLRSFQWMSNAA